MADFTNMLVCLNFTAAAALITTEQQIDTLDALRSLLDADIERLCKTARRSGGLVPNPNAPAFGQAPDPNNHPYIYNPGVSVALIAENMLVLTSFYLCHQIRIGQTVVANDIMAVNVTLMRSIRDHEEAHAQPVDVPELKNVKEMVRFCESLDSYLNQYVGETKVPLSYVIRPLEAPPISADDPSVDYDSVEDEMIARNPHGTVTYRADNKKVWEIVSAICQETQAYTWIQDFDRRKDGRGAYFTLQRHYLGQAKANNTLSSAETTLDTTF